MNLSPRTVNAAIVKMNIIAVHRFPGNLSRFPSGIGEKQKGGEIVYYRESLGADGSERSTRPECTGWADTLRIKVRNLWSSTKSSDSTIRITRIEGYQCVAK